MGAFRVKRPRKHEEQRRKCCVPIPSGHKKSFRTKKPLVDTISLIFPVFRMLRGTDHGKERDVHLSSLVQRFFASTSRRIS
eukprot:67547-Amphidinium_carterae.1